MSIHFAIRRVCESILLSSMLCGCATVQYRDWQEEKFSAEKEFTSETLELEYGNCGEPEFITGTALGKVTVADNTYYKFAFENVLEGVDRTFFVIACYKLGEVLLKGGSQSGRDEGRAQMLILPLNMAFRIDEEEFDQFRSSIKNESMKHPVVVLSALGYKSKSFVDIYSDGKRVINSRTNLDVGWVERSRGKYILSSFGYVLTVPFDVLTFPIQYLLLRDRL